ncbi:Probable RNA-directed DNA polymerase from transposon X-element [Eumeta japonica]|uniref:Probable RNA-directed DNA polymerase from transposon X-element n=1 Tax=Eumeta variegata TaxID=151549 RepID=A0A4C1XAQ7_EUMVA|nr:Probable RNA-directed DNA polymerase from transposon X-element [Eumeta japonica]
MVDILNACLKNFYKSSIWKEAETQVHILDKSETDHEPKSEQKFFKVLPFLLSCIPHINDIPPPTACVQLALFVDDTALYYRVKHKKSTLLYLQSAIDELGRWCVFSLAVPKPLDRFQVIQNKFCRDVTNTHWLVQNLILHRDLELRTVVKFMKDASKRFFGIVESYPNALNHSTVFYEPPQPYHFIQRPRNLLANPPDTFTAAVESLMEVNDSNE